MSRIRESGIPAEIITEFCPGGMQEVQLLATGKVNTTHLVTDSSGEKLIIQRMAPSSTPEAAEDFAVVSDHMRSKGWETATPIRGAGDSLTPSDDSGSLWRAYQYIPSDETEPPRSPANFLQFAQLIGSLHYDLAELDYTPQSTIPHFHDFPHYFRLLQERLDIMQPVDQVLGYMALEHGERLTGITGTPQLIHGDPKLTNALYRGGQAFTFIDWDTLMQGSPMLDVGDMLRSMMGRMYDENPNTTAKSLVPIAKSYHTQVQPETDADMFVDEVIHATRLLSLGLAVRYLIDTVDGSYFQWDPNRYPDSSSHNRHRALRQLAVFGAL